MPLSIPLRHVSPTPTTAQAICLPRPQTAPRLGTITLGRPNLWEKSPQTGTTVARRVLERPRVTVPISLYIGWRVSRQSESKKATSSLPLDQPLLRPAFPPYPRRTGRTRFSLRARTNSHLEDALRQLVGLHHPYPTRPSQLVLPSELNDVPSRPISPTHHHCPLTSLPHPLHPWEALVNQISFWNPTRLCPSRSRPISSGISSTTSA